MYRWYDINYRKPPAFTRWWSIDVMVYYYEGNTNCFRDARIVPASYSYEHNMWVDLRGKMDIFSGNCNPCDLNDYELPILFIRHKIVSWSFFPCPARYDGSPMEINMAPYRNILKAVIAEMSVYDFIALLSRSVSLINHRDNALKNLVLSLLDELSSIDNKDISFRLMSLNNYSVNQIRAHVIKVIDGDTGERVSVVRALSKSRS